MFYHDQSNNARISGDDFCLYYGGLAADSKEVGTLVCSCLAENGIGFEWDGSPTVAVRVKNTDAIRTEKVPVNHHPLVAM